MARTAQTDFVTVPSVESYPLEPILASSWNSAILNGNHAYRYLNPTVINQDLRELTAHQTVQTSALVGAPEVIASYRIPVYGGAAGQTLGGTFWAFQSGAAGAFTGSIRVTTSAGTTTVSVVSVGGVVTAAPYSFTGLALNTGGAPESVIVDIWTSSAATTLYVVNFSAWLEPSGTPLAAGSDGAGFYPQDTVTGAADQPLPSYRVSRLSSNAAILAAIRPGVVVAWSADYKVLARAGTEATATLRVMEKIPVRYGPKSTHLEVWINSWCDDGTTEVSVWTDQVGLDGASSFIPDTNAVWVGDPTGTWRSTTIALNPVSGIGHTRLHVQAEGTVANPMNIYGICVWED